MKARTYKKLLRLNQDEQERLRYLSKSTGLNQEQVLRKVLMDSLYKNQSSKAASATMSGLYQQSKQN